MAKEPTSQKPTEPSKGIKQNEKLQENGHRVDQDLLEQLKRLPPGSKIRKVILPPRK